MWPMQGISTSFGIFWLKLCHIADSWSLVRCFELNIISCLVGIKDYSNWPTIPQVFINGEFVGGCDIMLQMHQSGELIEELKKVGIKSALLTAEEAKEEKK